MSGLTAAMWNALRLMEEARNKGHDPYGIAANTMDQPYVADGQVFVAISTARALERRGLVWIDGNGEITFRAAAEETTE